MLHRVREIIEKLRKEYEEREQCGSMTSSNIASGALNALRDIERELDNITPIEGVWVEDYKIELFDPRTGEDLVCWNQPTRGMVDAALAVRTFYAGGPEALKKIVR